MKISGHILRQKRGQITDSRLTFFWPLMTSKLGNFEHMHDVYQKKLSVSGSYHMTTHDPELTLIDLQTSIIVGLTITLSALWDLATQTAKIKIQVAAVLLFLPSPSDTTLVPYAIPFNPFISSPLTSCFW